MVSKIGYVGYSSDLSHPADRRRIAAWAKKRNVLLNLEQPGNSQILVLSNGANFSKYLKQSQKKIILDLVDGYIGEEPNFLKDFFRNLIRTLNRKSSLKWITYTRHLKYACRNSAAVIVPSEEQAKTISKLNSNVFVILDDFSELREVSQIQINRLKDKSYHKALFWEGQPYTFKHFDEIAPQIDEFLFNYQWSLNLVTKKMFKKWGGILGNCDLHDLVIKFFPKSNKQINIYDWSVDNLLLAAEQSTMGIIPISTNDKFANLKSENKIIGYWNLNLPALFSQIPSYRRLAEETGTIDACVEKNSWLPKLIEYCFDETKIENIQKKGQVYIKTNPKIINNLDTWDKILDL